MNFDIQAFANALKDTAGNELGSRFPDGADADSAPDFNSVVYIVNTWPDWDQGMNNSPLPHAAPPLWPQ